MAKTTEPSEETIAEPTLSEVEGAQWQSLRGELRRTYFYGNGFEVVIDLPQAMAEVNEHRLIVTDHHGSSHVLLRGYMYLKIEVLPGLVPND